MNKIAAREGKQPAALLEKPILNGVDEYYLDAFNTMSLSRCVTFGGIGSIPLSEIMAYCNLTGVTNLDDRHDILYIITICDDFYMTEINKRAPKNGGNTGIKSKGRGRQSAYGRRGR